MNKELEKKYGVTTEGYPKEMMCWDYDQSENEIRLIVCKITSSGKHYPYVASDSSVWKYVADIEKPIRKIEDGLEYGDIIKNENYERKVLGLCGDIVFLSECRDFSIPNKGVYTFKNIIEHGYKLKTENND